MRRFKQGRAPEFYKPPALRMILAGLLMLLLGLPVPTSIAQEKTAKPLWELDLVPFGKPLPTNAAGEVALWRNQRGIVFTQPNELAVYFVSQIETNSLSVRNEARPTDPYHLKALFLNSDTGKLQNTGDWPVWPDTDSDVFAAQNGNFIVAARDSVSLHAPDMSLLAQYKLSWANAILFDGLWSASMSPAGDSLLVRRIVKGDPGRRSPSEYYLFETNHLSLSGMWKADIPDWIALWGNQVAWFSPWAGPMEQRDRDLYVMNWGGQPRFVARSDGPPMQCMLEPRFLNQSTIVRAVAVGRRDGHSCKLLFLSINGALLREISFDQPDTGGVTRFSKDGKFYIIATIVQGRFDRPPPRRYTYRVYSVDQPQIPLLTVDVPPALPFGGVSLSPNGEFLAVGFGTKVQVYRVPSAGK